MAEGVTVHSGAHDEGATIHSAPAPVSAKFARAESVPERIGAYRIVRELGRGGMGSVLLGVRDDEQFKRHVAIKVIKRGMDSEDLLRRFELERQVLATLNHPNIARMYEGGITEDGRSYFVMEHIDGQPLDQFADSHRLTINERLTLFRSICLAVHYAHQSLIVHRDLKPGNILVTPDGVPKLLDFGIAKLLKPEWSPVQAAPTAAEARLMTPEYASPEQVRGESVTTATDVYSLGVILYELLTGHRPYHLAERSPGEVERVISEVAPTKPSMVVTREGGTFSASPTTKHAKSPSEAAAAVADSRGVDSTRLRRRLSGDIDNIVLMALRKEPQRRYQSAERLAEDIQRHLDGLPVRAHPATLGYRTSKFVRRNKAGVAAGALVAIAVVAGVAGIVWQAGVAAMERDRARASAATAEMRLENLRKFSLSLVNEINADLKKSEGNRPVREVLTKAGAGILESLRKEAGDSPAVLAAVAQSYEQFADTQASLRAENAGDVEAALASLAAARDIREVMVQASPADVQGQHALAVNLIKTADILSQTDVAKSLAEYERAAAILDPLVERSAGDEEGRRVMRVYSAAILKIGDIRDKMGDPSGAMVEFRKSLRIREASLKRAEEAAAQAQREGAAADVTKRRQDDVNLLLRDLSVAHNRIASNLEATGDVDGALVASREALAIRERLLAPDPENARSQRDVAVALYLLSDMLVRNGRSPEAAGLVERMGPMVQRLYDADPKNARGRGDLMRYYKMLGAVRRAQCREQDAAAAYGEEAKIAEAALAEDSESVLRTRDLVYALMELGDTLLDSGDVTGAIGAYRRVVDLTDRMVESDPQNKDGIFEAAYAAQKLARSIVASGDRRGAEESARQALALVQRVREQAPAMHTVTRDGGALQPEVGRVLLDVRLLEEARPLLTGALASREEFLGRDRENPAMRDDVAQTLTLMARLLVEEGEADGAHAMAKRAVQTAADESIEALRTLSIVHERRGEREEAAQALRDALGHLESAAAQRCRLEAIREDLEARLAALTAG